MNPIIQHLLEVAFDSAEYPETQRYRIYPNVAFCQKFAELIVKDVLDKTVNSHATSMAQKVWANEVADSIKKRFEL